MKLVHEMIISCFSSTASQAHYYNELTFLPNLSSCKSIKELKQFHSLIIKKSEFHQSQQVFNKKVISLCASLSMLTDLSYIYVLFHQLCNPELSVYNDLIRCFSSSGSNRYSLLALLLYRRLVENGLVGDSYTYPFVLRACSQLLALREGQMVHAYVIKNDFVANLYVMNTLMRFYGVCRRAEDVRKLFDKSPVLDLISWTSLIQGYVDNGFVFEGMQIFFHMCEVGVAADEKLMTILISACAKLGDLRLGRKLHEHMRKTCMNFDVFVGNALVDMYFKCGGKVFARTVFKQMQAKKNVVSWNSMISGLSQSGEYKEALNVFRKMRKEGIHPNEVTLVGVLNSCANLGDVEFGKWLHAYIDKNKINIEGYIGNALIDMYSKCGNLKESMTVFEGMKHRDVYTYSTAITGLAMHGKGDMALQLFTEMRQVGIKPNDVTLVGVLSACCQSGLVNEGQKHFADMLSLYNIKPQNEHYGCMVDLFGRAGLLTEAYEFVLTMPIIPDKLIWGSLLGACRIHGNVELAEKVMQKLVKVNPEKDGAFVLMSNIYASAKEWKNVVRLRKEMKEGKFRKIPGCSSIELDGVVYEFRKGDKAHSKVKEVYMLLNTITSHLLDVECMRSNLRCID